MDDGLERFADWAKASQQPLGTQIVSRRALRRQRRRELGRIVHATAMEQTAEAFYDAAMSEIRRIRRLKAQQELEKNNLPAEEAQKHRALVRWLLVRRRREQGQTPKQIGKELGLTTVRVKQLLHSREPVAR